MVSDLAFPGVLTGGTQVEIRVASYAHQSFSIRRPRIRYRLLLPWASLWRTVSRARCQLSPWGRRPFSPTGVLIASYEPAGPVLTGSFETKEPSAAELARREKVKREG